MDRTFDFDPEKPAELSGKTHYAYVKLKEVMRCFTSRTSGVSAEVLAAFPKADDRKAVVKEEFKMRGRPCELFY